MVVVRDWGRMGSWYLMGTEFQSGEMTKFWSWIIVMDDDNMNVVNDTELYA